MKGNSKTLQAIYNLYLKNCNYSYTAYNMSFVFPQVSVDMSTVTKEISTEKFYILCSFI